MCRVTMGYLRVTVGHLRVTVGHLRVPMGHLRATKGHQLTIGYLNSLLPTIDFSYFRCHNTYIWVGWGKNSPFSRKIVFREILL